MNIRVKEIAAHLEAAVPSYMKLSDESWSDNVGLLVGMTENTVTKVLVALDITEEVIDEAAEMGAELIVSHHPLFFSRKNIVDTDKTGEKIIRLISASISAICLHTNLDVIESGVNTRLAEALGLDKIEMLQEHGTDDKGVPYGMGRIGELNPPVGFPRFLERVKTALKANGLRYHAAYGEVRRVAVAGGSGSGELLSLMGRGCDTLVTGDIKYHKFLEAKELGINLIDAGHFATENVVCPGIRELILSGYPQLEVFISERHKQTDQFY